MRFLALSLGRPLVLLLVLQFADVPIACADEWSSKGAAGEAGPAFGSQSPTADSAILSFQVPLSDKGDGLACYCPCHLTFQSSPGYWLPPPSESMERGVVPRPSQVPFTSHSLDHPPQN